MATAHSAPAPQNLIDVDFGVGTVSGKTGFAAIGQTANDFWNLYSRDDGQGGYRTFGAVSNLKFADGTVSSAGLTVANAPGAWGTGSSDPMYQMNIYPFDGGNITISVTNLPVGQYDVYLYNPSGNYQVTAGETDYGTKTSSDPTVTNPPDWQEGKQYALFRAVQVGSAGQGVTITVRPLGDGLALISGMQIVGVATACLPAVPGLVSWWRAENNAQDSAGVNHGTLFGGVGFSAGEVGQAFGFDGTGEVVVPNTASLNLQSLTFEAWINPSVVDSDVDTILNKENDPAITSSDISYELGVRGAVNAGVGSIPVGHLAFFLGGIAGLPDEYGGGWVDGGALVPANHWTHCALAFDGTRVRVYVNGALTRTIDGLSGTITSTTGPFKIGSRSSSLVSGRPELRFNGFMDEVSIYNRALSSTDIQAIYNAGSAGKCVSSPPSIGPFTNGSFELPVLTTGAGQALPPGSTTITGWTVGSVPGMGWKNGDAFGVNPVDGAQHIGFNGGDVNPGSSIFQTFTTTIGQTYAVSFNVGRTGPGGGSMSLMATVTSSSGEVLGSLDAAAPGSPGYGPAQTFNFTAATTTSTLTFKDTSSATVAVDPLLDNVSVTPISQCITSPSGLVHWWAGDGNANDAVGGSNGTSQSGPSFAAGKVAQAFTFDGVNDSVSFGNTIGNFDTNDFTIEFWLKTTSARIESIIEKWPICGVSSMWTIRVGGNATGRLESEMFSDALGNDHNVIVSGRTINDGAFHHVAYVRKGRNLAFYIDGILDVSNDSVGVTRINNVADLVAGRSVCVGVDGTSPFTGQLDEISIYNRALTPVEIQSIYNAGSVGKCLLPAVLLLNIDVGAASSSSAKIGPAAVGQSANDFWNFYTRDDGAGGWLTLGTLSNLKSADGTTTTAGLIVANAPGSWGNGSTDPMYDGYDYPFDGGNITLTLTNLPTGEYDFYLYASDGRDQLVVGGVDFGIKTCLDVPLSNPPVWQESVQYVRYRNVPVSAGQAVVITVRPGVYGYAVISGMQVLKTGEFSPPPPSSEFLMNIDVGAASSSSAKVGPAAVGQSANDFWNFYTRDDGAGGYLTLGTLSNLKSADRTSTTAGLIVANAPGSWGNGSTDPMYDGYDYPFDGGNITLTLTNLPTGEYDFYLYASDGSDQLVVGGVDFGIKTCLDVPLSNPPMWQEGVQYVRYRNVPVSAGQAVVITVRPGVSGYAVISGMQIAGVSNACLPAVPGLVSWWRAENNAQDSVGGNHGTVEGEVSFVSGEVGQAFNLNGTDASVSVPAAPSLDVGLGAGFSIECWINPAQVADAQPLVEWFQGAGPPWGVHFWISEAGSGTGPGCLYVNIADISGGEHKFSSAAGIVGTNSWQHVALTYERATGGTKLFYNGAVVAAQTLEFFTPQTSYPLYLGRRPAGTYQQVLFHGGLDEVTLYNRALTEAEILAVYQAGNAGKCTNRNPIAMPDTLTTVVNTPVNVPAGKLLQNDYDPESNSLTITAVSSNSMLGGTVSLAAGHVTYTPASGFQGHDQFTYSITNGHGGCATGTVSATVGGTGQTPLNISYGPVIIGGEFVVRFAGIPGLQYTIEAAPSLGGPWIKVANQTAPGTNEGFGIGVFEFRESVGAYESRFYRTVYPPY